MLVAALIIPYSYITAVPLHVLSCSSAKLWYLLRIFKKKTNKQIKENTQKSGSRWRKVNLHGEKNHLPFPGSGYWAAEDVILISSAELTCCTSVCLSIRSRVTRKMMRWGLGLPCCQNRRCVRAACTRGRMAREGNKQGDCINLWSAREGRARAGPGWLKGHPIIRLLSVQFPGD